jgi:hypothetical protein
MRSSRHLPETRRDSRRGSAAWPEAEALETELAAASAAASLAAADFADETVDADEEPAPPLLPLSARFASRLPSAAARDRLESPTVAA